jgi:hypothetical protein
MPINLLPHEIIYFILLIYINIKDFKLMAEEFI